MAPRRSRRCLIVERHSWETGGGEQQLQLLLNHAEEFFGEGGRARTINIRFFESPSDPAPILQRQVSISRTYANRTRRVNGFPEIAQIPRAFVFFEETRTDGTYDVWWQEDVAIVAALYDDWDQGRSTQYGRGRLSSIVRAPVPRPIERLP
jgi:hypothetical protein